MKTITLFDREMSIVNEFDMAVCIWETTGSNLKSFDDVKIEHGQKVYNIKILDSGSLIFTLDSESEEYIVTMFPQMFGFPTDIQLTEIKNLEELIDNAQKRINQIYKDIERTGHTDINL